MKHVLWCPIVLLLVLTLMPVVSNAQFTINRPDLDNILVNSKRMNTTRLYFTPAMIDLGVASASSQVFDFSAPPTEDLRDTVHESYPDPVGQPGASEFTGATLCVPSVTDPGGGGSITTVSFFSLENDGFYLLGVYDHSVFPPFLDQESVLKHRPGQLLIPLPLAYGTARSMVDTVDLSSGPSDFVVTTTTVTCDGWGDITFPVVSAGGVPKTALASCLRFTLEQIQETFTGGVSGGPEKSITIGYLTADGSLMDVQVADPGYTGGVAEVLGISFSEPVGTTDIRPAGSGIPDGYSLSANYPNPFNPTTSISFSVPEKGFVSIKVFDVLGREIAELAGREMAPGFYNATFDATDLPSGMYLYRMTAGSHVQTGKMNLVR